MLALCSIRLTCLVTVGVSVIFGDRTFDVRKSFGIMVDRLTKKLPASRTIGCLLVNVCIIWCALRLGISPCVFVSSVPMLVVQARALFGLCMVVAVATMAPLRTAFAITMFPDIGAGIGQSGTSACGLPLSIMTPFRC